MSLTDLESEFVQSNPLDVGHIMPPTTQRISGKRLSGLADALKHSIDFLVAGYSALILSPLLLMVSAILLVTQGRPIFIKHPRIGKGGVMFPCIKFRTMVNDGDAVLARHLAANPEARAEWEATRKLKDDPRVTAFGAILRKNSIDEIPQLLNILRGEMSLVGPRPITVPEAQLYGTRFADYTSVRPGLTGLWQVSGRSDITDFEEVVKLDMTYIDNWSLQLDIKILLRTVAVVVKGRGAE